MTQSDIARAEPIYEELPGWWEDISDAREFDDLPAKARDYVLRLEELAGAHVSCIGVGPGPRPDHRAPRRPGGAPVTDAAPIPEELDPDYDQHGGFPNFEAAEPGSGFRRGSWRRCGGCRIWRCRPTPTTTSGIDAADRAEALVELLGPFEAPEGVGPGRPRRRDCRAWAAC